jgi:hypothetical protein
MITWRTALPGSLAERAMGDESAPRLGVHHQLRGVLLVGALLSAFAFAGSWLIADRINPMLFEYGGKNASGAVVRTKDIWFDSDLPSKVIMFHLREPDQGAFTAKHPLYRLASFVAGYPLKRTVPPHQLVLVLVSAMAAAWAAAFFALMWTITRRLLDTTLFTLLALSSSAALFWLVLPETFGWGSLTIVGALLLAARGERQGVPIHHHLAVSVATLSVTVTNWMFGLLAAALGLKYRKALAVTVAAFGIVSLIWLVQKQLMPSSLFFVRLEAEEHRFLVTKASGGPLRIIPSFLLHTMVMPRIQVDSTTVPLWFGMTTQHSNPGSGTAWGLPAVGLWIALLSIGAYGLATNRLRQLGTLALVGLAGQLVLHNFYGYETFLYAIHFLPLLLVVAALGTRTRLRKAVLALAGALTVACALNNGIQLRRALSTADEISRIAVERGAQRRITVDWH